MEKPAETIAVPTWVIGLAKYIGPVVAVYVSLMVQVKDVDNRVTRIEKEGVSWRENEKGIMASLRTVELQQTALQSQILVRLDKIEESLREARQHDRQK